MLQCKYNIIHVYNVGFPNRSYIKDKILNLFKETGFSKQRTCNMIPRLWPPFPGEREEPGNHFEQHAVVHKSSGLHALRQHLTDLLWSLHFFFTVPK